MPAKRPKTPPSLQLVRITYRLLGQLLPSLLCRHALRLWFSTNRHPFPRREQDWMSTARQQTCLIDNMTVACYQWGKPDNPAILLVHGWNGRATQLGAFIEPLVASGFQVLAFDAPGHGNSSGSSCTIAGYSTIIRHLLEHTVRPAGIICHSFGLPATALAIHEGLTVPAITSLAAPASLDILLQRFRKATDMPDRLYQRFSHEVQQRFDNDTWQHIGPAININTRNIQALIIHDLNDTAIPVTEAQQLAGNWDGAELLLTRRLGHMRLLYNPECISKTVEFFSCNKDVSGK